MSLLKQWQDTLNNQTEETFKEFWERYSDAEKRIYSNILENKTAKISGFFNELAETYDVDKLLFMGFLDGINSSLKKELNLEKIDENTEIKLNIDFEKLYFNMFVADAPHLYSLPQWENVFDKEKLDEIKKEYKNSKTVVKEEKIGRNEPCPCGSGKKYKKCCGK